MRCLMLQGVHCAVESKLEVGPPNISTPEAMLVTMARPQSGQNLVHFGFPILQATCVGFLMSGCPV